MAIKTQIPLESKLKVLETGEIVILKKIRNFPTRYQTMNDSGEIEYFKTFEVVALEETTEDSGI